jgi:hypothetical protein
MVSSNTASGKLRATTFIIRSRTWRNLSFTIAASRGA